MQVRRPRPSTSRTDLARSSRVPPSRRDPRLRRRRPPDVARSPRQPRRAASPTGPVIHRDAYLSVRPSEKLYEKRRNLPLFTVPKQRTPETRKCRQGQFCEVRYCRIRHIGVIILVVWKRMIPGKPYGNVARKRISLRLSQLSTFPNLQIRSVANGSLNVAVA